MFKIAIWHCWTKFIRYQGINFGLDAFEKCEMDMHKLGLGVPTGIDLPGEVSGVAGNEMGKVNRLSIGQYDTYTPLQLAQFAATLANGGKSNSASCS